jgi:DNA topoisomerase-2
VDEAAGEPSDEEEKADADEQVAEGEISPKEYDYLLTMPLWSLSDEKVEELNI